MVQAACGHAIWSGSRCATMDCWNYVNKSGVIPESGTITVSTRVAAYGTEVERFVTAHNEDIEFLCDHLDMKPAALVVDMLDDVLSVWVDVHSGGNDECDHG